MVSIKTRLILLFSIVIFSLLSVCGLFMYWLSTNFLYKADYEFLADEVATIQYILEKKPINQNALIDAVQTMPQKNKDSLYRYFTRIVDQNKKVLMETKDTSNILSVDTYLGHIQDKHRYFWHQHKKQNYLVIQSPIYIGNKKNLAYVQVLLDVSHQKNLVRDSKKIFGFLLLAGLISSIVGYLIANRSIKGLYLLIKTAERISTQSLDKRISVDKLPKEFKKLGRSLNDMFNRIETSFLKLKQFSDDLAHELRRPITNLIGQTEVALHYPQENMNYEQLLSSNLEELQRLSRLIENMLFLARAENPKLVLNKTSLDIAQEIRLVCDFYQAMIEEKFIHVNIEGQAFVQADKDMFRRAISNLISNALRHTAAQGYIKFSITSDASLVKISIQDNGCGIDHHDIPKLFDRFFRAEAARSEQGYGLGLPIVKSIIELHDGKVVIESTLGLGTIIFIFLPL